MTAEKEVIYSPLDDEFYVVIARMTAGKHALAQNYEGDSPAYYPPEGQSTLMLRHIMAESGSEYNFSEEAIEAVSGMIEKRLYDEKKKTPFFRENGSVIYYGDGTERNLYYALCLQEHNVLDYKQCDDWGLDFAVLDPAKMKKIKPERSVFFREKRHGLMICHKTVRDTLVALNPHYGEEQGGGVTGAVFVSVKEYRGSGYGFVKEWD